MAVEVRIPTILRPYTAGAKAVEGSGATLADLIGDLESRHPGLSERLIENDALRRFVNVYLNDEDVRFLGGLSAPVTEGDNVTILRQGNRLIYKIAEETQDGSVGYFTVGQDDVLHFPGLGFNGIYSQSVIGWAARQATSAAEPRHAPTPSNHLRSSKRR